jgi:uncharacterized membrane protein YdjX (TVP38/TMEM64 family)
MTQTYLAHNLKFFAFSGHCGHRFSRGESWSHERAAKPLSQACPASPGWDVPGVGRAAMTRSSWSRTPFVRFAPLLVIAAAMLLVFVMGWHRAITLENIVVSRDHFHLLLAAHPVLSVLAYVLLYVTVVALSLPGALVLTLSGGLLFGTLVGGVAALVGATLGATLVFLIARTAIADANLSDLAGKLGWLPGVGGHLEKLGRLDALLGQMKAGFKTNAMSYLLFLRFVPAFPFWAVNLMAAILGVPLKTYVVGTFFGMIPATMAFASLGAGLDSVVAAAKVEHEACVAAHSAQACSFSLNAGSLVTRELILAFVLLGIAALVPVAYKRWRKTHGAAD